MITRDEAYAWMDRQADAFNVMRETLGRIENITYTDRGIHVYNLAKLAEITNHPYVRSYLDFETDLLHFRYRGINFYGISWEKRIGKRNI